MLPLRDHSYTLRPPVITFAIIIVNILVFLAMLFGDMDAIISRYALIPSKISWNDPSTLLPFVTSQFLHGGFLHIISNLWFLRIFGDNVEERLGHFLFFIFYLVCGVAGGMLQYIFNPLSSIPMVGASGAIAGVLGSYLFFFPRHRIETLIPLGIFSEVVNLPAQLILIYWFVTQFFSGVGSIMAYTVGGIAFWAHVGGFAAGYMLARVYSSLEGPNEAEEGELLD
jgi:membrane associated rhomboid family serine protease